MNDESLLTNVAMQIILHAGDARNESQKALDEAKKFNFEEAQIFLNTANEYIRMAHKDQTEIIQKEADGFTYDYSLLFTHAQDTLMTIKSEISLAQQLIDILKIVSELK